MGLFSYNRKDKNGDRLINNRFLLALPSQWVDRSVYRFEGPLEDGIQHHIMVNIEHDIEISDLDKYAALQIKALETELTGYHELKRGALLLDDQMSAYELVYKWCPVDHVELYQRQIWMLHKRTGFAIMATFSKKTWKLFADQIDRIMRSFSVRTDG